MPSKNSNFLPLLISGILGFLGVALGAFGAHGLKSIITPDLLLIYETGSRYHLIHSVVLFVIALSDKWGESKSLRVGFWGIFIGILIFSGSLYVLTITGLRILGAVTPIGGVSFLVGWLAIAYSAFSFRK
ncbi:DUF423 domain-containing protein [Leptospira wolffii]|uniref:DUF423 domain-containing protein n=1 Tax=Leptospira wolffii TaxID=409998 RepID=UPI001082F4BA|nr:DUF423 domain-containing protein [Leptospira wolffii]TGK61975.1 DUF423 domain-containing protein [Leptospira wolffii]TGK68576.1 DUF423 domain-containing protein [Leptospira wolffii]TGK74641.1 DUF423 domain-containing protein [Leptospira wolffii]TGL31783.1 DUF423 domain-containing protein [Leptospira wolffii]